MLMKVSSWEDYSERSVASDVTHYLTTHNTDSLPESQALQQDETLRICRQEQRTIDGRRGIVERRVTNHCCIRQRNTGRTEKLKQNLTSYIRAISRTKCRPAPVHVRTASYR
jgi:hypothetical protein